MNPLSKPEKNLTSKQVFLVHFARNLVIGGAVTLIILLIGMIGYLYFEKSNWLDAYVNSAMIISGVGTLNNPVTSEGKLFVATYSLIGGGVYLLMIGVVFSPIFHWFSHRIQLEDREHFKS